MAVIYTLNCLIFSNRTTGSNLPTNKNLLDLYRINVEDKDFPRTWRTIGFGPGSFLALEHYLFDYRFIEKKPYADYVAGSKKRKA